jgi:hypothetical protein
MDRREQLRQAKARHGIPEHDERELELGIDGRLVVIEDGGYVLVPDGDPLDVEACERALTPIIADNA